MISHVIHEHINFFFTVRFTGKHHKTNGETKKKKEMGTMYISYDFFYLFFYFCVYMSFLSLWHCCHSSRKFHENVSIMYASWKIYWLQYVITCVRCGQVTRWQWKMIFVLLLHRWCTLNIIFAYGVLFKWNNIFYDQKLSFSMPTLTDSKRDTTFESTYNVY